MLALMIMLGSAVIFLAGGLYLSIAMEQDAVNGSLDTAPSAKPRVS